jgi:UDP:flavonoid glycosyltransferase YjiC (YdhE family)
MRVVENAHAGRIVRSGLADRRSVREAIAALMHDGAYRAAAGNAACALRTLDSAARFSAFVDGATRC